MPRMIVSIDGVVIKDVQLSKQHTTLGRRPYNDIVIDNLAVSGEHAVLHMDEQEVEIEDLGSTNGTYVNAKAVRRQMLHTGDTIEVGRYKIRFVSEAAGENYEKTMVFKPSTLPAADSSLSRPAPMNSQPAPILATTAIIRVLSGAAAGREVTLHKVVTTVGKPGLAVASITRRHQGFVLAHVEGTDMPLLNGQAISASPAHLKDGDRLELAGTVMQFEQR